MLTRDLIMAAPKGNIGSAGGTVTLTLTVSEPGVLHLPKMVISANQSTAANHASADVSRQVQMSSCLINGAVELIRGRGTLAAPVGAFAADRGMNQIPLPAPQLQAGDTVAIVINSESTNIDDVDVTFAAPFSPSNVRSSMGEPRGSCVYASSVVDEVATDAAISCAWTADEAGIISLSGLQIRAFNDIGGSAAVGAWENGLAGCVVTGIVDPQGNAILIGQNGPGVAATYFGAGYRRYVFGSLGSLRVAGGDVITVSGTNLGSSTVNFSWGSRFWPDKMTRFNGCA